MRSAREALTASRRAPLLSALGVVTIAFSLFAFGLFGLVAINIRKALDQVEERVEVRAFVSDSTDIESVAAAMKDIGEFPEVLRVDYVSKEKALERARKEMGEFADVFEAGVLPASIEVHLRPGMRSPTSVRSVADRMKTYSFIDDVRYGEEWVEKLYRLRNIATVAGIALGVGWVANSGVNEYFMETIFFDRQLVFLGVVGGAVMGVLGSLVSVGRHLRRI